LLTFKIYAFGCPGVVSFVLASSLNPLILSGYARLVGRKKAAGLRGWWVLFADVFGHATLSSDLINALVGAVLGVAILLSPIGNLPVIHALFKSDGLGYPGIISFCLASAIHPRDIRIYVRIFDRRQPLFLSGLLFGVAVLGSLGSTWIYAALGF